MIVQIVPRRQKRVGHRLRFHALAGVHHQQRAFAGRKRPRNFVGKIHVPRRIDQVQPVFVAVPRLVVQPNALGLDGDAALALQIHRVEHLRGHLALAQRAGQFQQAVGQRRLAVVDVRNDAEISDVLGIHGLFSGGAAPVAAMRRRLVRANHAFQTSEFAIHRAKNRNLPAARAIVFPPQCFAAQSQRIAKSAAPPVAAGFSRAICRCLALAFSRLAFRCHPDRPPSAPRDLLHRLPRHSERSEESQPRQCLSAQNQRTAESTAPPVAAGFSRAI